MTEEVTPAKVRLSEGLGPTPAMTVDGFFAEAKRLGLRMLGTPEETRAALDLKDAEIALLRTALHGYEALQRDAERYRWLRLQDWDTCPLAVVANPKDAIKLGHDAPSRERLDAMIDAHVAEVQGFLDSVVDALDGRDLGPNDQAHWPDPAR